MYFQIAGFPDLEEDRTDITYGVFWVRFSSWNQNFNFTNFQLAAVDQQHNTRGAQSFALQTFRIFTWTVQSKSLGPPVELEDQNSNCA